MNEWSFDPEFSFDGESQGLLEWKTLGLPWLKPQELAKIRLARIGNLGTGLDGKFRGWLEWGMPGMCVWMVGVLGVSWD